MAGSCRAAGDACQDARGREIRTELALVGGRELHHLCALYELVAVGIHPGQDAPAGHAGLRRAATVAGVRIGEPVPGFPDGLQVFEKDCIQRCRAVRHAVAVRVHVAIDFDFSGAGVVADFHDAVMLKHQTAVRPATAIRPAVVFSEIAEGVHEQALEVAEPLDFRESFELAGIEERLVERALAGGRGRQHRDRGAGGGAL